MDFAQRLKSAMSSKGITMYRLSKELGVHQTTVSNWAGGKSAPRTGELKKIAAALDTTPDYLMGWSDIISESKSIADNFVPPEHLRTDTIEKRDSPNIPGQMEAASPFLDALTRIQGLYENIAVNSDFDVKTKAMAISVLSRDTGKELMYKSVVPDARSFDDAFRLARKEIMDFIISAAARVSG